MSDQDIFSQPNSNPVATPPVVSADPFADLLSSIRNENGEPKYKDVQTALQALQASQQFISTLKTEKQSIEQENAQLKKSLEEIGSVDDLIKRLNPSAPQTPAPTPASPTVVSEEVIVQKVEDILSQREKERLQRSNLEAVVGAVTKQFGEQSAAHITKRAAELGTTTDALKALAANSPAMALELLLGKSKQVVNPSLSQNVPPHTVPADNEYPKYERGVARGGMTNKELVDRWKQSVNYTNKRIGLETN